MSILFDTSTLVAAFVGGHPSHSRALVWLQRAKRGEFPLFLANHTLAELYAVLTTLPVTPRIVPSVARRLIEENTRFAAKSISLTSTEYRTVLGRLADLDLTGGVVYDALILKAARKAGAQQLVTSNVSDFERVWQDGDPEIVLL